MPRFGLSLRPPDADQLETRSRAAADHHASHEPGDKSSKLNMRRGSESFLDTGAWSLQIAHKIQASTCASGSRRAGAILASARGLPRRAQQARRRLYPGPLSAPGLTDHWHGGIGLKLVPPGLLPQCHWCPACQSASGVTSECKRARMLDISGCAARDWEMGYYFWVVSGTQRGLDRFGRGA
jgi:hypothetical protein